MTKNEFEKIQRRYIIDNLNYWFLTQKTKEVCNLNTVIVLYFYKDKDCQECTTQGIRLTYFKKLFEKRLLVFPLDMELKTEPMLDILKSKYNITILPTTIIENKKFEGVISQEELKKVICSGFNTPQEECKE